MALDQVRPQNKSAGKGPFVLGLLLIASATALNLYLDGKSRADLDVLPPFLLNAYEQSGKFGVSMVLASLGLFVMIWGWFLQTTNSDKKAAAAGEHVVNRKSSGPGSSVQLDTEKYVADFRTGRQWWTPENHRV
jgi:hypothetical protein